MLNYNIRAAQIKDVNQILELIKELAIFEKAEHELINTERQILEDIFGPNPVAGVLLAELGDQIIGISVFYTRYSTWKGKCLYLEDLIVTEAFRNNGIGKALFQATIDFGKQQNMYRLNWQVLDWNQSAVRFYDKFNAQYDKIWWNGFIDL